jgi:hypothetical protein
MLGVFLTGAAVGATKLRVDCCGAVEETILAIPTG